MSKYRRRKANRRFRRFMALIYVLIFLGIGMPMIRQQGQMRRMEAEKEALLREKAALEAKIEDLRYQDQMKESMAFVEAVARQKLGMIRYNEMIVKDLHEEKLQEDDPIAEYRKSLGVPSETIEKEREEEAQEDRAEDRDDRDEKAHEAP